MTPCNEPSEREWLEGLRYEDKFPEPTDPCLLCAGEGAIGTGYSNSFADCSDAMECPQCEGTGSAALLGKEQP